MTTTSCASTDAMTTDRSPSESFPETVTWLCDLLQVDRRMATFLIWDVCFKVGTDRHHWIDLDHARRYIADNP